MYQVGVTITDNVPSWCSSYRQGTKLVSQSCHSHRQCTINLSRGQKKNSQRACLGSTWRFKQLQIETTNYCMRSNFQLSTALWLQLLRQWQLRPLLCLVLLLAAVWTKGTVHSHYYPILAHGIISRIIPWLQPAPKKLPPQTNKMWIKFYTRKENFTNIFCELDLPEILCSRVFSCDHHCQLIHNINDGCKRIIARNNTVRFETVLRLQLLQESAAAWKVHNWSSYCWKALQASS